MKNEWKKDSEGVKCKFKQKTHVNSAQRFTALQLHWRGMPSSNILTLCSNRLNMIIKYHHNQILSLSLTISRSQMIRNWMREMRRKACSWMTRIRKRLTRKVCQIPFRRSIHRQATNQPRSRKASVDMALTSSWFDYLTSIWSNTEAINKN